MRVVRWDFRLSGDRRRLNVLPRLAGSSARTHHPPRARVRVFCCDAAGSRAARCYGSCRAASFIQQDSLMRPGAPKDSRPRAAAVLSSGDAVHNQRHGRTCVLTQEQVWLRPHPPRTCRWRGVQSVTAFSHLRRAQSSKPKNNQLRQNWCLWAQPASSYWRTAIGPAFLRASTRVFELGCVCSHSGAVCKPRTCSSIFNVRSTIALIDVFNADQVECLTGSCRQDSPLLEELQASETHGAQQ